VISRPPHRRHHLVGELPVVAAGRQEHPVDRQAVAQDPQAEVADEVEVLQPALVVAALLQLVPPHPAVLDGGVRALDAGREHEVAGQAGRQALALVPGAAAVLVARVVPSPRTRLTMSRKPLAI
jgi:hypothetical protein